MIFTYSALDFLTSENLTASPFVKILSHPVTSSGELGWHSQILPLTENWGGHLSSLKRIRLFRNTLPGVPLVSSPFMLLFLQHCFFLKSLYPLTCISLVFDFFLIYSSCSSSSNSDTENKWLAGLFLGRATWKYSPDSHYPTHPACHSVFKQEYSFSLAYMSAIIYYLHLSFFTCCASVHWIWVSFLMEKMWKRWNHLEQFSIQFWVVTSAVQVLLGDMNPVLSKETAWLSDERVCKNRSG